MHASKESIFRIVENYANLNYVEHENPKYKLANDRTCDSINRYAQEQWNSGVQAALDVHDGSLFGLDLDPLS